MSASTLESEGLGWKTEPGWCSCCTIGWFLCRICAEYLDHIRIISHNTFCWGSWSVDTTGRYGPSTKTDASFGTKWQTTKNSALLSPWHKRLYWNLYALVGQGVGVQVPMAGIVVRIPFHQTLRWSNTTYCLGSPDTCGLATNVAQGEQKNADVLPARLVMFHSHLKFPEK